MGRAVLDQEGQGESRLPAQMEEGGGGRLRDGCLASIVLFQLVLDTVQECFPGGGIEPAVYGSLGPDADSREGAYPRTSGALLSGWSWDVGVVTSFGAPAAPGPC